MGRLSRAIMHGKLIFAQNSQEGIQMYQISDVAKVLLSNIYTVNKGGIVLRILCWLTIMGHIIISYNILETYMLYLCFKAIKSQTEKSRESIGQENYNRRKR